MIRRANLLGRLFKKTLRVELKDIFEAGMQSQRECCLFALRGHLDEHAMATFLRAMDWESGRVMAQPRLLAVRERRLRLFGEWDA